MGKDLDKLIRTWESMVASGRLSENMTKIILMTITELKELKKLRTG